MKQIVFDGKKWPHIPDGIYEAQCIKYEEGFFFNKARKLLLIFRIISEGPYQGVEIFIAYNMPYEGRIKENSKYFKDWVYVNGWTRPSRNAKMHPRIFINKILATSFLLMIFSSYWFW